MNIVNRNSDSCSLLISSLEDVSTDYESSSPFLIKNISGDTLSVQIKCSRSGDYVTTSLDPGWNPELCVGIKGISANQVQIGR